MNRGKLKIIAYLLSFAIIMSSMSMNTIEIKASTVDATANLVVSRTVDPSTFSFDDVDLENNDVTLTYTVDFDPILVDAVASDGAAKDVVIVIDNSGSMKWQIDASETNNKNLTRLSYVKDAANELITQLNEYSDVNVSIITYSTYAQVIDILGDGDEERLIDLSENYDAVETAIDGIDYATATNIGDGIRLAYHVLDNGEDDAEKYMVFMTDGEANTFSYDSIDINSGSTANLYFAEPSDYTSVEGFSTLNNYAYAYGDGDPTGVVLESTTYHGYDYALEYAETMAEYISGLEDFTGYYIAFSDYMAASDLSHIAEAGDGVYYSSYTSESISEIYSSIGTTIAQSVKLDSAVYEETFPENIEITDYPSEFSCDGQLLTMDFGSITYTLNEDKTQYEADSISFDVTIRPITWGSFILGSNNSAGIHIEDFDGDTLHFYFDSSILTVNEPVELGLDSRTELNILEIQPGRTFELDESDLDDAFSDYSINLVQVSILELNGMVDAINGKYDIIYIGAAENYSDVVYDGVNGNYIEKDVDLTSNKANELIAFVETEQMFVYSTSLSGQASSADNISGVLDNVSSASTAFSTSGITQNAFYGNLESWYSVSQHRPTLTVTQQPVSYTGLDGEYNDDNYMSYLYNAFNDDDNAMITHLYIDINGDGLYTDDEEATYDEIPENTSGLVINYGLDDSFNGLMPWKLELTDVSSGTKDYKIGYTAFKGDKTIVHVLQLSPGDDRIDLSDEEQFSKPLITDDYEIYITNMLVKDFDTNFPNEVDGNPTVLNGNYDMVIFGFGDLYAGIDLDDGYWETKDITNSSAIDAINSFIDTEQSIMFTHDTTGHQDWSIDDPDNYNVADYDMAPSITENFKKIMGLSDIRTRAGYDDLITYTTTEAYMLNEGLITMYPYVLAQNSGSILEIADTHGQYWEMDLEIEGIVPWFTLNSNELKYFPAAYYYTFTNGTITYSGTGHSTPDGEEEQELFVNTMLKASRGANRAPTMDIVDLYESMNVQPSTDEIPFTLTVHDPDIDDVLFDGSVVIVKEDGTEISVLELEDIEKDLALDLIISVPDSLVENENFVIRVDIYDKNGAKGSEEFNATYIDLPTLKISNDAEDGYLVGDTFDVNFVAGTVEEGEETYIKNASVTAVIDTTYMSINSVTDLIGSGTTYSKAVDFETDSYTFSISLTAESKGTSSIDFSGTYDAVFNDTERDDVTDNTYTGSLPVNIDRGIIKINVSDNVGTSGRAIEDASVVVQNSSGVTVYSGTTDVLGNISISPLPTDIYTVSITGVPSGYILGSTTSATLNLNYSNSNQTVNFKVLDNHQPTIIYDYSTMIKQVGTNVPIHLKIDGINSSITVKGYKKLADGVTTATAADFTTGTYMAIASDTTSTYTIDDTYQLLNYFNVTSNGYYAVYIENEAGQSVVEVIQISLFYNSLPDSI